MRIFQPFFEKLFTTKCNRLKHNVKTTEVGL
jgi:hypothetical protein